MADKLPVAALDQLFNTARTRNGWTSRAVTTEQIHEIYELMKWGPTSANSNPARFVWVQSSEGKSKLAALASEGNRPKIMAAPVTVIVGQDLEFYEALPRLFPARGAAMKGMFSNPAFAEATAFRNSSLQGAYLIVAARALGLDCGPMSGFDNAKVDAAFFQGSAIKSNFLCNLGYGDPARLRPRAPRLAFDAACRID